MAKKKLVKTYENQDLEVYWEPRKCIHSAKCVQALPEVFNPNRRPWIKMELGESSAIKAAIDRCPSGALSYAALGNEAAEANPDDAVPTPKLSLTANGPIVVHGPLRLVDEDGQEREVERTAALCRCGASARKPYCDGTHAKIDYRSDSAQ